MRARHTAAAAFISRLLMMPYLLLADFKIFAIARYFSFGQEHDYYLLPSRERALIFHCFIDGLVAILTRRSR